MRTLSFVPRAASSATPYVPDEATKKKCSTRCDDICKSSDSSCKGHCVEICNNDPKQAVTSTTPTPTPTPDPVKECPKKCDDICKGFESSCNGNCVDICLSDAARRAAAAAPVKKDLIPSLGGTSKSDGPAIAAGSADYQSCLSDCYHNGQDADIAFHVSQHDGSCEEQCTALSASSATILVKKQVLKGLRLGRDSAEVPADDDTAGNEIPVSAPLSSGPAIGAGSVDYDSCMRDCNQNCQSADIGFPVTQCDGSCKDKCTALSASGAGSILVKKQVLGGLGLGGDNGEVPADDDTAGNEIPVSAPQSGPAIGAGSVDYDSCMRDCNQNCQTADIGFPVTQCDGSCKEKCEALSGSGAAVLGKRQAVPVPTLLPSTRLPIPSLSTRLPLSVPTSTRISLLPTITSAASAVPSALAPCECGLQCANADDIAATLICVEACLAECPSLPKETGPVSIKSL
ncbi:hypothetical protein F4779DRAFT_577509 [Xylariaceae sp. FL0662B]|nr:hypothetical protein F4779DRAFT_577509 [Xylariaceae sp. FL0662B]